MTSSPDLFASAAKNQDPATNENAPLAVRMRPTSLEEVIGQDHLLAEGKLLRRALKSKRLSSMIFYGPPGIGKTTLARLIAKTTDSGFVPLNAVASNVSELRKVIGQAQQAYQYHGKRTVVFVDEIHRFNKSQQDVLMPEVENGELILLGATTHNPSFSINGPLLSRSLIFELRPLSDEAMIKVLERALQDPEKGYGKRKVLVSDSAKEHLVKNSSGDARRALNSLEVGVLTTPPNEKGEIVFNDQVAAESCQRKVVYYDADEDYHYDTISAFIKSMRGSDPDSAVYWLAKMLYAGEDPRFIVRRILILASEDIGNADPQALILASSGLQAVEFVGMPEAQIILSQLVTYMALAPKSNASYQAISKATQDVKTGKVKEVPNHLRDGHYAGAKRLGHGEGYQYSHAHGTDEFPVTDQEYGATEETYYSPKNSGFERELTERLKKIKGRRKGADT